MHTTDSPCRLPEDREVSLDSCLIKIYFQMKQKCGYEEIKPMQSRKGASNNKKIDKVRKKTGKLKRR